MTGGYCTACGGALDTRLEALRGSGDTSEPPAGLSQPDVHIDCRVLVLDPPRFCHRCGRHLDVQVLPTGYRASCRRCEGAHPARRHI